MTDNKVLDYFENIINQKPGDKMGTFMIAIINFIMCAIPLMIIYSDQIEVANPIEAIFVVCIFGGVSWFIIAINSMRIIDKLRQSEPDKQALDFWQNHQDYNVAITIQGGWIASNPQTETVCHGKTLRECLNTAQRMHFELNRWEEKSDQ